MNKRLQTILSSYRGKKEELIPILQHVQSAFGYLPEKAMIEVAKFTRVPESRVYAVATFYAQFRFTPIGKKHIMVCRGTSCHVRGVTRILEEIEKPVAAQKPTPKPSAPKEEKSKPMLKNAETAEEGEFFKEAGRVKYKVTVGGKQLVIYLAWNNWGKQNYYCNIISGMNDKVVRDFQPIVDFNEGKCFGFN